MFDFTDQVVMITGAAGSLGRATTHTFHDAGARVAVVDRERQVVNEVFAGEIPEGDYCFYVAADLTEQPSVTSAVERIIERFGRIDVLCNIAGGFYSGKPVHETPLGRWDFMMNLNARSVFLVNQAVIPYMLTRQHGKIINVAARAGLKGAANMAAYTASKSAVIRLTESMAAELKSQNINVNCILPGTIDTPQNREAMPNANFDKWVAPEAMADVFMFLASDAARAIHGAAVPVYGRS